MPDGGSTYLLPRLVGKARAMEMMLLGDKIGRHGAAMGPGESLRAGRRVDGDRPGSRAGAGQGPGSSGAIRKLVWDSLDNDWTGQLHAERKAQKFAGKTEDFIEGVSASCKSASRRSRGADRSGLQLHKDRHRIRRPMNGHKDMVVAQRRDHVAGDPARACERPDTAAVRPTPIEGRIDVQA